jgi:hypothetical protein|tara:strand:- start:528 stop:809 length:282 start_codon:yes stop_codon:yes gene_type:complete
MEAGYVILGLILAVVVIKFVKDGKSTPVKKVSTPKKPAERKPSNTELKKLTKNQLLDIADKKGIKGVQKSGAKAKVISQIRDNWEDDGDEEEL